ncbi:MULTISPECIES: hypothetical protein [unclassified Variovorax]|uniref:hypothetical protein n=1 Tax=unclassified Variovorax TaxID=663243 RepID=UPI0013165483|nr:MULTISPECIES: hypothetical protein [unclassified Variovorax]VTU42238.1 hypothetical protein SRS16P1_00220 [Variovorax sp. SRS16]VTU42263.1 hypothetical protein E5P1_00218 [Variovorax sp. PBL-E5]VTU44265.1 hypothetical protein H6P1_00713 [Variovorax sp. PBL-H6]
MKLQKHPPVNKISVSDAFRVRVFNIAQEVHYMFQAHSEARGGHPVEFSCHMYDSASCDYAAYIDVETIPTDSHGHRRCCATGNTLDELVSNLDLAHRPSELAELRMLLATRSLTNKKQPIGDLVLYEPSAEQRERHAAARARFVKEHLEKEKAAMTQRTSIAIEAAAEHVAAAAKFGIRRDLAPNFDRI